MVAATPTAGPDPAAVFVVHGRDESARNQVFAFLRSIGLRPMEWTEAVKLTGSTSPYVGDVLDAAFSRAQAILVLFTPDDTASLHPRLQHAQDADHERRPT